MRSGRRAAFIVGLAVQVLVLALGAAEPYGKRASALEPSQAADAAAPDAGADAESNLLTPLESDPPVVSLPVPGFLDAVLSVPLGARTPRPVVVATHGLWDFPEGVCDNWRSIVGDRAWVSARAVKPGRTGHSTTAAAPTSRARSRRASRPSTSAIPDTSIPDRACTRDSLSARSWARRSSCTTRRTIRAPS